MKKVLKEALRIKGKDCRKKGFASRKNRKIWEINFANGVSGVFLR